MVRGLPGFHIFMLVVLLISIGLPFLQLTRTRYARRVIGMILLFTIVLFVVCLLFASHIADRSDLVLLRCYAFSSSFCPLMDELLSERHEETTRAFLFSLLLVMINACTFLFLIGGISGIV